MRCHWQPDADDLLERTQYPGTVQPVNSPLSVSPSVRSRSPGKGDVVLEVIDFGRRLRVGNRLRRGMANCLIENST